MAEEIHSANIVIPWCMVSTTLLNGILGFAMLIVMLFVTVDISAVLASPTGLLGFPFMQVLYDATGSIAGASAMISIIIIMDICAAMAFLATSSRIVFAFGRDRGLPFSQSMATVCWSMLRPLSKSWLTCCCGSTAPSRLWYPHVRNHGHGWRFLRYRSDQHRFRNGFQRHRLCRRQQPLCLLRPLRVPSSLAPHQWNDPPPESDGRYYLARERTGLGSFPRSRYLGYSSQCLWCRIWYHRIHFQLLPYHGQSRRCAYELCLSDDRRYHLLRGSLLLSLCEEGIYWTCGWNCSISGVVDCEFGLNMDFLMLPWYLSYDLHCLAWI